MPPTVLEVRGISKSFAGVKALDNVHLTLNAGEIHALAGENGSGKSTLIKIVSGVYEPDEGEVEIDGQTFARLNPTQAINAGVQVIYQDFSVFPNLTVMENLALTAEVAAGRKLVNWRRVRQLAERAVEQIDFTVDLDANVRDLSVADKQLVAIARALLHEARVIIMDEPTTALTSKEVEALFRVVLQLRERGIAILFVSHKLGEVFQISDRFTIIRNGKLVVTSEPQELSRARFAEYMTGRRVDDARFEQPESVGEPLLEVSGLGLEDAFQDVSFTLSAGEVLGITGLLGSGRTELALALFGVFPASQGDLRVRGRPTVLRTIQDAIRNGIAYVPEDRLSEGLMLERSIADNIVVSRIDAITTRLGFIDRKRRRTAVSAAVDSLRIATKNPANPANTLSGGNQQRVVLAKWLGTNPDILILNGPTVGVDIGSKHEIHTILQSLAREGMGIIVISDDIPELLQTCRRILLLKEGRIAGEIDPETSSEQEVAAMITGAIAAPQEVE